MTWLRHAGDSKFHAGGPAGGSFLTLCDGRWPLSDVAYGYVERHANPPAEDRCGLCVERSAAVEAERTEVHMLVDYLLMAANDRDGVPPLMGDIVAKFARELQRLRQELEARTYELHVVERELADTVSITQAIASAEIDNGDCSKYGGALVEALEIAKAAGRRGLLSLREQERLRELGKVVPQ